MNDNLTSSSSRDVSCVSDSSRGAGCVSKEWNWRRSGEIPKRAVKGPLFFVSVVILSVQKLSTRAGQKETAGRFKEAAGQQRHQSASIRLFKISVLF